MPNNRTVPQLILAGGFEGLHITKELVFAAAVR